MKVLVFDTETTGLPQTKIINPDTLHLWPYIVQFSYIIYDTTDNTIIETNDYIILLENIIIPEESIKFHGITNEISSKVELLRIIYGNILINEPSNIYKNDLFYITNLKNICCTLQDSIKFCNIQAISKYGKSYLKYPKLIELHQKLFNTTPNNLHNSLNDILVTLRCFMKLKFNIDLIDNCETFKNLTNLIF